MGGRSNQLDHLITRYFTHLFTSSNPEEEDIRLSIDKIQRILSEENRQWLDRDFTKQEIKEAIFSIGSIKAPGPDGYSGGFF